MHGGGAERLILARPQNRRHEVAKESVLSGLHGRREVVENKTDLESILPAKQKSQYLGAFF